MAGYSNPSGYNFKVATPSDLQSSTPGSAGIDINKLKADPTKYSDYIQQRLSQNDFDPAVNSTPGNFDPQGYGVAGWGDYRGGDQGEFQQLAQQAGTGIQKNIAASLQTQGTQNDIFQPIRNRMMSNLAGDSKATRSNMMSRGFGYGGAAQGAQAGLLANYQANNASAKQDVQTQANQQASDINANLISQGIQKRNTQQQMYDSIYNSALQHYIQERQASGAAVGAIGAIAGAFVPGGGAATVGAGYAAGNYLGQ